MNRFALEDSLKKSLEDNDVELMKFAMKWLKFSLFAEGSFEVSDDALRKNIERIEVR